MERQALKQTFTPRLGRPASGVVVTGGASGIGLASAQALAAVGRPVALWDLKATEAKERAEEIADEFGVITLGVGVDIRGPAAIREAAGTTRGKLSSIGGIVHCAGTVDTGSLEGITPENWTAGIDVHLRAIVLLLQTLLEDLKRHPGSAVVAMASINATPGNALNPIYSAAKGGMLSLVRGLVSAEYGTEDGVSHNSRQVRVTLVAKSKTMQDSLAAAVVTRSLDMARKSLVRCRVSDEVRDRLRAIATQGQITESALVRQLLEAMVQMATDGKAGDATSSNRVVRDARLYVRLAPEDRILLRDRAAARGMPSATFVSVLLRAHLRNLVPLPKEELLALKRSVAVTDLSPDFEVSLELD